MFNGDYKKRCLLTIMVSQILLLTLLISEIKNTLLLQTDFSLQMDAKETNSTSVSHVQVFTTQHNINDEEDKKHNKIKLENQVSDLTFSNRWLS